MGLQFASKNSYESIGQQMLKTINLSSLLKALNNVHLFFQKRHFNGIPSPQSNWHFRQETRSCEFYVVKRMHNYSMYRSRIFLPPLNKSKKALNYIPTSYKPIWQFGMVLSNIWPTGFDDKSVFAFAQLASLLL